jgi:polyisoprenoid-binding protein YceI
VLLEMEPTGTDGRYRVRGAVTFRGVTREHTDELTVHPIEDGGVRLEGRSSFDVRDFGMDPPRILMLRVEPQVDVRVDIVALEAE